MEKEQALNYLRAAKSSHVQWVQRAKLLINGVEINKDAIPIDSTECKFGKWFYVEGQKLNALSNNPIECMTKIEQLHFELHDIYLSIFNIYFNKPKQGFFVKLFGNQKTDLSVNEINYAKEYYDKLEKVTYELIEEINRLDRRLLATSEEKIKNLL